MIDFTRGEKQSRLTEQIKEELLGDGNLDSLYETFKEQEERFKSDFADTVSKWIAAVLSEPYFGIYDGDRPIDPVVLKTSDYFSYEQSFEQTLTDKRDYDTPENSISMLEKMKALIEREIEFYKTKTE